MQNRNLLFFASDFQIGLAGVLTDQLKALYRNGIKVVAVAGDNEQEPGLGDEVKALDIPIIRISGLDYHSNFIGLVKQISKIIKDNNINVIHVQNNWQLALANVSKIIAYKFNIKIIYTIHGFRNNHPIKSQVARIVISSALLIGSNRVICMTDYLKSKFRILSNKIIKLPLGIKDEFFDDDFLEPNTDSLKIVYPAQFRLGKNQDVVIRAFAEYVKISNDTSATLTLPGSGDRQQEMKELASKLKIDTQVIFPGQITRTQVLDLYRQCNIAVVASNSETYGQSIVEPYVLGRCVVSTNVGIAPEIIHSGENGYVFKDSNDLTYILASLASNKEILKRIATTNFSKRDTFRWNNIISKYKESLKL